MPAAADTGEFLIYGWVWGSIEMYRDVKRYIGKYSLMYAEVWFDIGEV